MADPCVFCRIAAGELDAEILHEDEDIVAFRDAEPQAPMHVLVIPRKHVESPMDLAGGDDPLAGKIVRTGLDLARAEGYGTRGCRLVFNCGPDAGYAVHHVHMHVLAGRKLSWPPG